MTIGAVELRLWKHIDGYWKKETKKKQTTLNDK
jgi:hypothetical protein